MKTYRDYLNAREIPRGPWCILELNNPIVKGSELWYSVNSSKESQNGLRLVKTPSSTIRRGMGG